MGRSSAKVTQQPFLPIKKLFQRWVTEEKATKMVHANQTDADSTDLHQEWFLNGDNF